MQTRVDELSSDKHLKMSFIEFLEALARAANYLSYPPPTQAVKDAYKRVDTKKPEALEEAKNEAEDDEEVEMTIEEMINQPLHKKIENIFPYLLANCTKRVFRKRWVWPIKTPKYGLYEDVKSPVSDTKEVKSAMTLGLNKLIFSKMNIQELLRKKKEAALTPLIK